MQRSGRLGRPDRYLRGAMSRRILLLAVLAPRPRRARRARRRSRSSPPASTEGGKLAFTVDSDQPAAGVDVTTDGRLAPRPAATTRRKTQTLNFAPSTAARRDRRGPDDRRRRARDRRDVHRRPSTPDAATPRAPATGTIVNDDQPSLGDRATSRSPRTPAPRSAHDRARRRSATTSPSRYATADDTANGRPTTPRRAAPRRSRPARASATITVPITNDDVDEDDERFKVTLASPQGATSATRDATRRRSPTTTSASSASATSASSRATASRRSRGFPVQLSGADVPHGQRRSS